MKYAGLILAVSWAGLWLTPDQQGQRLLEQKQFTDAAKTFDDPMRQGVAWYRAGEFEKAVQAFSRVSSAESSYNQGNAWVLLGKYDRAIQSYQHALKYRPSWKDAQENLALAKARAKQLESKGGDMGDQKLGADEIVFDQNKPKGGQDTEIAGEQAVSDASVQAIWLRQVQTKPADFLKAKFAYQNASETAGDNE
ncbi:tetratricopeptide repeat protein [Thalassoroseus pseudoceratinae]|uniref:tetratricopeptide repeat protein n=1 Tax=Thalassoroseus pseudoceratinae TaxID=2713176 RepID=UPI0014243FEB|nr:tetratricopeptide repeat protein [Thalassoroseus pseudoceratinae]